MAKLRCESFAERVFVPAFIFFFQMLYPFAWANDPRPRDRGRGRRLHAGAATRSCAQAGGIAAIRGALIDDCALAKRLKAHGPIWLGLTERVRSIRAYPAVEDIRRMVCALRLCAARLFAAAARRNGRSAWRSPIWRRSLLALFATGCSAGPRARRMARSWPRLSSRPALLSPVAAVGLALPAIAAIYMAFTLDSAYQHARGRGGMWKGAQHPGARPAHGNVSEPR